MGTYAHRSAEEYSMDQAARRRIELLDAMESCRAGTLALGSGVGGDLNDPQFAELASALGRDAELRTRFESIQRADVAIKVVFADVPVPADLAERILHRLSDECSAPNTPALPCPGPVTRASGHFPRRQWITGLSAIAVSAAVLAGLWLHFHRPLLATPQDAVSAAMACFSRDNGLPGELASIKPPPADYPISPDIVRLRDVRWRPVKNFLGGDAVAYDLLLDGSKATLYVAHRDVGGLPAYPPSVPALSTGGNSAAAWQSGSTLYVLVVQGDTRASARYLVSGPLT
jgi:hypothetical protein